MTDPKIFEEMKAQTKARIEESLFDIRNTYRIVANPRTPQKLAAALVVKMYEKTGMPLDHYTIDEWLEMFAIGGFTPGVPDASRPLTLYRGCWPHAKEGLSWSTDFRTAVYFAHDRGGKNGQIYRVQITEPEVVFRYENAVPAEVGALSEVLIDPRRHDIEHLSPSKFAALLDVEGQFHVGKKAWYNQAVEEYVSAILQNSRTNND
ncbi:hypothetical protein [Corynebacterium sp.]|uniref:hypothetical protein n=1 Tax=Corynebacterium sp. TaxID=1720 RepID=UPI0028ACB2B0|nr:hypothetical protein [Corynebacterium sp.]